MKKPTQRTAAVYRKPLPGEPVLNVWHHDGKKWSLLTDKPMAAGLAPVWVDEMRRERAGTFLLLPPGEKPGEAKASSSLGAYQLPEEPGNG